MRHLFLRVPALSAVQGACLGAPSWPAAPPSIALSRPRPPRARAAVLAAALALALAATGLVSAVLEPARPVAAPASTPAPAETAWPPGLYEAARAALEADAYGARPDGPGWRAPNPAQGMETSFSPAGVEVRPAGGAWALGMSLAAWGRPGALAAPAAPEVVAEGQRVEYRRGGLSEWYHNDPRGLEQGFTLAQPPAGHGPVVVAIEVSGPLGLALDEGGAEVVGSLPDGTPALRYSHLLAYDATGRALPARMGLEGGTITLAVDDAGAAYPVTIDPLVATEQAHVFASDPAAGDEFGYSVAVSGDTAVVGAPFDDTPAGSDAGSAYVFVRSGGTWTQQAHLFASDAAAVDNFGASVAVSGDTAVVGAPGDDTPAGADAGSAYVFVRSGGTWTEQAHLSASGAAAFDLFGRSVAVSGDTAVVGAPLDDTPAGSNAGSAYVFVRSGGTWSEQAHLFASDAADGDNFGRSVAVSGDTAVVGAPGDTPAGSDAGSAYVFVRSGTTWAEQAHLFASDAAAGDGFGWSVAVSGDTAVVGALFDDTPAGVQAGSAYVFVVAEVACGITGSGDIAGTSGPDVICGSAGPDRIAGLGGDDVIFGFGGNDRISGGDGDDTVFGGDGDDQLLGDAGNDTLMGEADNDAAVGGESTDTCSAEATFQCEP